MVVEGEEKGMRGGSGRLRNVKYNKYKITRTSNVKYNKYKITRTSTIIRVNGEDQISPFHQHWNVTPYKGTLKFALAN